MFYDINGIPESCCCKDCGTTNESRFEYLVTNDWCDDCLEKSLQEYYKTHP